jgi:hypothetical protein
MEKSGVIQYLEQSIEMRKLMPNGLQPPKGFEFTCIEELVFKHGCRFKPQPLPRKYKKLPYKQCFQNAVNLMLESGKRLIYCEGYGTSVIPVLHAWCVDKKGNVIDPTWDYKDSVEYFGIPFDPDFVMKSMFKSKYYGILDNWHDDYPLLRCFNPEVKAKIG